MRTLLIGFAASLLAATGCLAQSVIGTSVINGKTVELMSDFSWRYKDKEVPGCKVIKAPVSFCEDGVDWKYTSNDNTDAAAMYEHDDSNYAEFIIEHLGLNQGMTMETLRQTVLGNAAEAAKTGVADVPVLADEKTVVDGVNGETLIYSAIVNKLPVTFYNTIVVTPTDTLQLITFSIGAGMTDQGRRLHQSFLKSTHLK